MFSVQSKVTAIQVGHLQGHSDQITIMIVGYTQKQNEMLITGSKDNTIIIWKLNHHSNTFDNYGQIDKTLTGHSHIVSDLALFPGNEYLLSASWDKTMRLWDLKKETTIKIFSENGHNKEVLSCAISSDGRQILSSDADGQIKLWNTLGQCKHTFKQINDKNGVTGVKFIQKHKNLLFASVGWDGYFKIWDQNSDVKYKFKPHDGSINSLTTSQNKDFISTGGKDKIVRVFDLNNIQKPDYTFNANSSVNCLAFHPENHWIAIGTQAGWKIWNFLSQDNLIIDNSQFYQVTSIAWNNIGNRLFVGFNNGNLKVFDITQQKLN